MVAGKKMGWELAICLLHVSFWKSTRKAIKSLWNDCRKGGTLSQCQHRYTLLTSLLLVYGCTILTPLWPLNPSDCIFFALMRKIRASRTILDVRTSPNCRGDHVRQASKCDFCKFQSKCTWINGHERAKKMHEGHIQACRKLQNLSEVSRSLGR